MNAHAAAKAYDGGPAAGVVFLAVPTADAASACAPFGGLGAFLSPAEMAAARRFRRSADRLDYEASHALFRLLAAWWLGLSPREAATLHIARHCGSCGGTDHGKPSVAGVALSLSRSHGAVMAAAGPAGSTLGADIERVPEQVFDGFDDFAAAPAELAELALADARDRTRLWVAKEAVLKAAGVGLAVEPSSVVLARPGHSGALPGTAAVRDAHLRTALCPAEPRIHGLELCPATAPPGYVAAVAARGGLPARRLSLRRCLPHLYKHQTSNV